MIKCRWCDRPFKGLPLHLRNFHRRTPSEYRAEFPDDPLVDRAFQIGEMRKLNGHLKNLRPADLVCWLLTGADELRTLVALRDEYFTTHPPLPWTAVEMQLLFLLALRLRQLTVGRADLPPLP